MPRQQRWDGLCAPAHAITRHDISIKPGIKPGINPGIKRGMKPPVKVNARQPAGAAAPRTEQQLRGQAGEDAALAFLQQQGLTLVMRNFRCKAGEIDLVMAAANALVFVEVRQRASSRFGGAGASIGAAKQRRLILTAQFYLQRYRTPPPCRFDVVTIDGGRINWITDAIST